MNGVSYDRQARGQRLFYVANPDLDEPRAPSVPPAPPPPAPPPPMQAPVRLLPPITTAPAHVSSAPLSMPNRISSSGSSSDRSSPTFNTSASSASPITPDSPTPTDTLSRHNLHVLVTGDNSSWWPVDLTKATTGASIREMIYTTLKIPDEDHDITGIFRTKFHSPGPEGDALTDSSLLATCEQFGDSEGSLRFALGKTGFPRSSAVLPPPQPAIDLPISQPLRRLISDEIQLRDGPSNLDALTGYEASDEGSSKRSGHHVGYKHARRELSSSPPSAPNSLNNYRPGASSSLSHYARSTGGVPISNRPHRALPQQPSPSRSNHSRTPSDQDPQPNLVPGGWSGSPPTQAIGAAERLNIGLAIPRSASSCGPRVPDAWQPSPVGMGSLSDAAGPSSSFADTSIKPPPRNESREPIPASAQLAMSPSRGRAPPVVPLQHYQRLRPPATRAPVPPPGKVPFQLPQFIHTAASNPNIAKAAAAQQQQQLPPQLQQLQRRQNDFAVPVTPEQTVPNHPPYPPAPRSEPPPREAPPFAVPRPDPVDYSLRRPSIPYVPQHFNSQQRLAPSVSQVSNSISINPNLPSNQSRPSVLSPRSPASPHRLIGARSHESLRQPRGVRPLPYGPTPLSSSFNRTGGTTASPTVQVTTSGLSHQRHYPPSPSPSSSASPVGPPPFGASRASERQAAQSHRRPYSADSNNGNGSDRGTSGERGSGAAAGGSPATGSGASAVNGNGNGNANGLHRQGAMRTTAAGTMGGRFNGAAPGSSSTTSVSNETRNGNGNTPIESRAGGGAGEMLPPPPPSHPPLVSASSAPNAQQASTSPIAVRGMSQGMMRVGSAGSTPLQHLPMTHAPPSRPERPRLSQLYVPEASALISRDSDGEPLSAASHAHSNAMAKRQSLDSRYKLGGYPSPQSNDESTVLSTDHEWLAAHIEDGGSGTIVSTYPTPSEQIILDTRAQQSDSGGSTTPRSGHYDLESGTNLTVRSTRSSGSVNDDEDGTLWQVPGPKATTSTTASAANSQLQAVQNANRPELSPLRTTFSNPDNAWQIRPGPEVLYEQIDKFFPKVNLDEPMVESTPSPTSGENQIGFPPMSPTSAAASPYPPPPPEPASAGGTPRDKNHRKSIRVVADERSKKLKNLLKTNFGPKSTEGKALGRRVTRFWGNKVEEVQPHGRTRTPQEVKVPDTPTSTAPERPQVTFRWVRGDLIGKGSYGRVYHAMNINTGEIMAVKQVELPKTPSDQDDRRQITVVEALKSESATLSTLDHPHVVQYLGFEETPEFLSIFLEYVPGGSIGGCMRKYGKFSEDVVKSFTHQVLEGLAYLHEVGILHRDLKGDNILLDPSGICKITDFGISRHTEDIYSDASHTVMQGSIYWMAPEVITNNHGGYSAKIDVWSLGCVVLEMWGGRRPWGSENQVSVMFKLGTSKAAPPVPDDVQLGELAEDFRQKCFAIDPALRPTAAELVTHEYLVLPSFWVFPGFPKQEEEPSIWDEPHHLLPQA